MISRKVTVWIKFGVVLVAFLLAIGCSLQTQCRTSALDYWKQEVRPAAEREAKHMQAWGHSTKLWFQSVLSQEGRRAKSLEQTAKGIQERNKELQELSNEGIKEFIKE